MMSSLLLIPTAVPEPIRVTSAPVIDASEVPEDTREIHTHVKAQFFCLHRRTIESYIAINEYQKSMEASLPQMKFDLASGECVQLPGPGMYLIEERVPSGKTVVRDEEGASVVMEPVRYKSYWTILAFQILDS